jgi:hypothetical protein
VKASVLKAFGSQDANLEQNVTLSTALNHAKLVAAEGEKVWTQKEELAEKLKDEKAKNLALLLRCDGTVSTDEFNAVKKKYDRAAIDLDRSTKKLSNADGKLETAATAKESLMRRISEYMELNNELKSVGTPRPTKMDAGLEQLGTTRKAEQLERTNNVVDWLVAEVVAARQEVIKLKKRTPSEEMFFFGRGPGEDVPIHFRTAVEGKPIRNQRLKKGEVETTIKAIWHAKKADDAKRKEEGQPPQVLMVLVHQEH